MRTLIETWKLNKRYSNMFLRYPQSQNWCHNFEVIVLFIIMIFFVCYNLIENNDLKQVKGA